MFAAADLKWTVPDLIRLIRTVRANKKYKIYYIIKAPYYDKFAFNVFFFRMSFFSLSVNFPEMKKFYPLLHFLLNLSESVQ